MTDFSLLEQVLKLRLQGNSIRKIASELGIHPSKVQRLTAKLSSTLNRSPFNSLQNDFVGRTQEMTILIQALEEACMSGGRIVMVNGESGIGKTRLTEELEVYARLHDIHVYRGRCYEESVHTSYWPWIQIINSYLENHSVAKIRSEMKQDAAVMSGIVPEIRQKVPGIKNTVIPEEPSSARFQLFYAINSFLKRASIKTPLLLIIDNLQWADIASLRLLEFLAEELRDSRILLTGVYRDADVALHGSLDRTIGIASRQSLFSQITLQRLTEEETGRLVRFRMKDAVLSDTIVSGIVNRAEGNPLFVSHIIRELKQQNIIYTQPEIVPSYLENNIPVSLRAFIGNQLYRLSPVTRNVLSTAAVIGRNFNIQLLLATIEEISGDVLFESLKEAVKAGIISELKNESGHYQFTHVLLQDTLIAEASSGDTAALHSRIGYALENLYDKDISEHAAQLAYHFSSSSFDQDTEKAVYYYRLAGEWSMSMFAYEEAIANFRRALVLRGIQYPEELTEIPDEQIARILLNMVRASTVGLPFSELRKMGDILARLLEYYMGIDDMIRLGEVIDIQLSTIMLSNISKGSHDLSHLIKKLDPDSVETGRVLCGYGQYLGFIEGKYAEAEMILQKAMDIALRRKDHALELRVMLQIVAVNNFLWRSTLDMPRKLVTVARTANDLVVEHQACGFLATLVIHEGNYSEAERAIERGLAITEKLHQRFWQGHLDYVGEWICHYKGDWEKTRSYNKRAMVSSARNPLVLLSRVLTEYEFGDFSKWEGLISEAVADLESMKESYSHEYAVCSVQLACIDFFNGNSEHGNMIRQFSDVILDTGPENSFYGYLAKISKALDAVNRGDTHEAGYWYRELKEPIKAYRERTIIFPIFFSTDRFLGLLARTCNETDMAVLHFKDSWDTTRKYGFVPLTGWACFDYARTLLHRGRPGDRSSAISLVAEGYTIADNLGMTLLKYKLDSLDMKDNNQPVENEYNLTLRELEVLRLLSKGRTNRMIASELFISEHTVATHVRRILHKTNLSNRTEAAAYAIEKDI